MPHILKKYRVSGNAAETIIGGVSMGGVGALSIGLKNLGKFGAIVVWEPAIDPVFEFKDLKATHKSQDWYIGKCGVPLDEVCWKAHNPASILHERIEEIRKSGVKIYIEVGTHDEFRFFEGADFIHRMLFDSNIPHEYRYVYGAGHFGPPASVEERTINGWSFLNHIGNLPK